MTLEHSLRTVLNVRPGEDRPLVCLLLHSFFLGLTLVFLESAAGALFLNAFDAAALPYAYLGIALVVTIAGFAYTKLQGLLSFPVLLLTNLGFLLAGTVGLWFAVSFTDSLWPSFVALIWAEVVLILTSLELWGLAGQLFNVRQGKRLFGLVGAGGMTAVVIGGISVPYLAGRIGTPNLLLFSCGGMAVSLLVLVYILRAFAEPLRSAQEQESPELGVGRWSTLRRDPYLLLIFLLAGLSMFAYYVVDFIFYDQVEARYTDQVKLASFFGAFFAVVGVTKLVIQTFVSGRVISRFGLSFGLLTLPVVLAVGTGSIAVGGALVGAAILFWFAVATKLGDDVTRGCIDEPSVLILYQPLRPELRIRVQSLVEGMVEPVAGGLAAGCLLLLTSVFGFDAPRLADLLIVVLVAWLAVGIALRRQYTKVLTSALAKRSLAGGNLDLNDGSSAAVLKRGLDSPHPGQVLYCLNMLQEMQHPALESFLVDLLNHPAETVRTEALRRLERWGSAKSIESVSKRLETEPTPSARGAALRTLCALGETDVFERVSPYLADQDPVVRNGAIVGLLRSGGIEGVLAAGDHLTSLVRADDASDRRLAAEVLGDVGTRSFYQPLVRLLQDGELSVRRAALVAAGVLQNSRLWPLVVENLSVIELRRAAAAALLAGGESALPELESYFAKAHRSPELQCRIVSLCGRIGGSRAARWLFGQLHCPHKNVRHRVLEAMTACEFRAGAAVEPKIREMIEAEVQDATRTLASILDIGDDASMTILSRALHSELAGNRHRVFLLLSFIYPRQSILHARDNYAYPSAEKRAYALEVVDNIVAQDLKEVLVPLLDDIHPAKCIQRLSCRFFHKRLARSERLAEIIDRPWDSTSPWTQATALFMVGHLTLGTCLEGVSAALSSPAALVRQTAAWTLARLNPPDLAQRLRGLLRDEAPQVVDLAKFVLRARGFIGPRAGRRQLTRSSRVETELFASVLLDPLEDRANRCRAAHALAFLDPEVAFPALVRGLQIADETIRSTILDAMRSGRFPTSDDARRDLTSLLHSEVEDVQRTLTVIVALHGEEDFGQLTDALCHEIDLNRKRILSIFDLLGDRKAFDVTYFWFVQHNSSPPPDSAVHRLNDLFADVSDTAMKQRFLDLFLIHDPGPLAAAWRVTDDGAAMNIKQALEEVAFGSSRWIRPWTRVCALHRIASLKISALVPGVVEALKDPDTSVREMAVAALFQLDKDVFNTHGPPLEQDPSPAVSRLVRQLVVRSHAA